MTDAEAVKALICEMEQIWKQEFGKDEPGLTVDITETAADQMMDETSTDRVIAYLDLMPDGVAAFEREIEGQVETSLNAGVVKTGGRSQIVVNTSGKKFCRVEESRIKGTSVPSGTYAGCRRNRSR